MIDKKLLPRRLASRERRGSAALLDANERLRNKLLCVERECRELTEANANVRVERDAADVLLGEAMDDLLDGGAEGAVV
jgi:hypothetical protein